MPRCFESVTRKTVSGQPNIFSYQAGHRQSNNKKSYTWAAEQALMLSKTYVQLPADA